MSDSSKSRVEALRAELFACQRVTEERSLPRQIREAANLRGRELSATIYAIAADEPQLLGWLMWPVHESSINEARARVVRSLWEEYYNGNLR